MPIQSVAPGQGWRAPLIVNLKISSWGERRKAAWHCYEANTEFSSYDFLVHTLNTSVDNELADHDFYLWRSYAGQLIRIDLPSRKLMSPGRHENIGN